MIVARWLLGIGDSSLKADPVPRRDDEGVDLLARPRLVCSEEVLQLVDLSPLGARWRFLRGVVEEEKNLVDVVHVPVMTESVVRHVVDQALNEERRDGVGSRRAVV